MANVVKPYARLFFPCEEAFVDVEDGAWRIINPLHTVSMPAGIVENFRQQEIYLYAQLAGGVGEFLLSVQLRTDSGIIIGNSDPYRRRFTGGIDIQVEVFQMTNVPFARPGVYEFQLMANHSEIDGGTVALRVLPG